MKVIVFIENNQKGGVDTFCSTLLNNWPDRDDSFVLVCNASHPGQMMLREAITRPCQFETHDIPLSWTLSQRLFAWLPPSLRRVSQPFLRIALFLYQMSAIRALFQRIGGDALIVINGGFPGGESCRIANIAWVALGRPAGIHNFHGYAVPPRRLFRWYENWVDRQLAMTARYVVGVSRGAAESLRVRPTFRCSEQILYVYNGIQVDCGREGVVPDLRSKLGIGGAPLCLMLANYEPWKGHRFLFKAFKVVAERVPEVHLVLCGGGGAERIEEVDRIRREVVPTANIHLLDFVPGGARLVEQADLLVISSQCFESFGLAAVEAMARGVPVVATRVGGLPEVVGEDGDGGYSVAADDPGAFAERVLQLLRDPALRRQVGERGRKRVATHFTAERMASEYHAVLAAGVAAEMAPVPPEPRSEWHYVMRRCLSPAMAWDSVGVVVSAVLRRLGNRVLRRRDRHYPPEIRALASVIPAPPDRPRDVHPEHLPEGPRQLKLAIGHLAFDGWPKWDTPFDDHEQLVSLHRWNWLLRALTDETRPATLPWGVALIRSWLATMSPLPGGDAGESYSTGERIVNACLFARHVTGGWAGLPEDILRALECMAADLAQRVEYHGGDLSGNHVLNNGRALLFAGHCCSRPELVVLGRALLAERLPVLLADGRFLREGSSHYQFLFTRWLLELRLLAAERGDAETLALLAPHLPRLLEGCRFFRVDTADGGCFVPTFGDISPDCEPAWLWDLPASPLARFAAVEAASAPGASGWATLFGDCAHFGDEMPEQGAEAASTWRAYSGAGWYRLDFAGWVAIWRVESSAGPAIASHAHHDVGSCVVYRHGREVLIDPGRLDYGGTRLGRYGIGGDAHNGVTLDGRPPMLSRGDRLLPQRHRRANCAVSHHEDGGVVTVTIEHDGFARLGGGVGLHSRRFVFSVDQLLIVDRLEGRGRYWVEARFHRPLEAPAGIHPGLYSSLPAAHSPRVSLERVEGPAGVRESALVACEHPIGGWRFPAYGVKEPALTQRFAASLSLPAECRYRLFESNG